jgi:ribosomal protein S18 acetylase RimI-like enzyme/GrpB-like predicted nucleotidyltransferase (UPF0157 family)
MDIRPESKLRPQVTAAIERQTALLGRLVPGADLEHIGATAVPGSLTKGDLDLMVRVPAERFEEALAALESCFERNHPDEWTPSLASFNERPEVELPVGVQLVVAGSIADRAFAEWRDRLRADPELLGRYNELKTRHAGDEYEPYTQAKGELIEAVLWPRGPVLRPADPGDHRDIAALWTQAFYESPEGGRAEPYGVDDVEESAAGGGLLVIEQGVDLAAGVALMRGGEDPGGVSREDEAEVCRLAVAREIRRRGHARRLLDHCHALARERGVEKVVLWSRPEQTAGHALYRSLGYQRLPERDRTNERGEQIVFGLSLREL